MIETTDAEKKKVLMSIIEDMSKHNTSVVDMILDHVKFKVKLTIAITDIKLKD